MARRPEPRDEMRRSLRSIALGALVAVALALFFLWRTDNPRVERARMALIDWSAPTLEWSAEPIETTRSMIGDFENFTRVYEQNKQLRREIQRLKAWREAAQRLEQENARLRALNNVKLAPSITVVTGEIIADSGGPFAQSALINIGQRDGVDDGAAAVDGRGLIGRVVGLGDHAARLLLLTDLNSRVPVLVRPSGRGAVLAGDGSAQPVIRFLSSIEGVAIGDQIVTSGDGGVFPPDLPIGRISALGKSTARARLAADYDRLEFVRVLRYRVRSDITRPGGLIVRDQPGGAKGAPDDGGPGDSVSGLLEGRE